MQTTLEILAPEERPDFRLAWAFLWGEDQPIDSEGNSYNPASRTWTELYMCLRTPTGKAVTQERFNVNPI